MFGKKVVLLVVGFTLLCVGCGGNREKKSEELRLQFVSAEQGVTREVLLLGVREQKIQWVSSAHGTREFFWDGSSPIYFSPEEGDRIIYTGSAGGVVVVAGEAVVGKDNPLIVPLRRLF